MKILRQTRVITHRGLDPQIQGFPFESTQEAFQAHLERGYGLEFDIRFTRDGGMVAIHDANLTRASKGTDKRAIVEVDLAEILAMDFDGCHLMSIPQLLQMIQDKSADGSISAMHLKAANQSPDLVAKLLPVLEALDPTKFLIFDTKLWVAKELEAKNLALNLAASVSDQYDVERFNTATGETLITLETLLANKDLFSWVWLDEWDRVGPNGTTKTLLTKRTFDCLRDEGIRSALVTPELHFSSPSQPTAKLHEDGQGEALLKRLAEIVQAHPDAMCTDNPDTVRQMIERLQG